MTEFALIDNPLFLLMQDVPTNLSLTNLLLDTYFPGTRFRPGEKVYFRDLEIIEDKILAEKPEVYREETERLLKQGDEEEVFLRGSLFKKEIPKIYDNTCCISGYRIDSLVSISMIDACHIRPFSECYDDTIGNGIALCPNLHRAFDRGIITINPEYKVVVSSAFTENDHSFSIRQFQGKSILLPEQKKYWPDRANLEWHNVFFEKKHTS